VGDAKDFKERKKKKIKKRKKNSNQKKWGKKSKPFELDRKPKNSWNDVTETGRGDWPLI
jgi:hypothetical protein